MAGMASLVGAFSQPAADGRGPRFMGDVAERDDIVFVEKDMAEESRVTPLKDRGARTTEPLESRYLRGLYGAVPRVRDR